MSTAGKASELNPREIARAVGLDIPSGPTSYYDLVDYAVQAYWANRPQQSPQALTEYRRRQKRRATAAEVWIRRAGAA